MNEGLLADFHRRIKNRLSKRQQGLVMGDLRDAIVAHGQVTDLMVREALAHAPFELDNPSKWLWVAEFLNDAMAYPDRVCPCCNVTAAGDIRDAT